MCHPAALRLLATLALIVGLAGCATAPATSLQAWQPNRTVSVVVAPFWREFPPDAAGLGVIPQRTLARGTRVRLLRHHFGFAEVQLDTLERGWLPRGLLER